MSRTYRRKGGNGYCYGHRGLNDALVDTDWVWQDLGNGWLRRYHVETKIDPKSKEGKKRIAKFHSESSWHYNKRGTGWWRREFIQRPHRRDADRQIRKAMKDDDYEVVIRENPKRPWWD